MSDVTNKKLRLLHIHSQGITSQSHVHVYISRFRRSYRDVGLQERLTIIGSGCNVSRKHKDRFIPTPRVAQYSETRMDGIMQFCIDVLIQSCI